MYFKFISWAVLSKFKTYFKIKVYLLLQHRKIFEKSHRIIDELIKNLEQTLRTCPQKNQDNSWYSCAVTDSIVTLCNSLEAGSGLWCLWLRSSNLHTSYKSAWLGRHFIDQPDSQAKKAKKTFIVFVWIAYYFGTLGTWRISANELLSFVSPFQLRSKVLCLV